MMNHQKEGIFGLALKKLLLLSFQTIHWLWWKINISLSLSLSLSDFRFSGTIIDVGSLPEMSKSMWADSDWRSLKVLMKILVLCCGSLSFVYLSSGHQSMLKFGQVQWDEPSSILRPDRISPWEVEPLDAAIPQSPHHPLRNKRARPPASPSMVPELPSAFGKDPLTTYKIWSVSLI